MLELEKNLRDGERKKALLEMEKQFELKLRWVFYLGGAEVREGDSIFFLGTSFNLTFRKMCIAETKTIQARYAGNGLF